LSKALKKEEDFKRDMVKWNFAQLSDFIIKDLNSQTRARYSTYNRDNVQTYLNNPIRYSKELQSLSSFIYNNSTHYRRFINFLAKMPTLDHYVELKELDTSKNINEKTLRNNYIKAIKKVENMNIKHEFQKVLKQAWKVGTFYGYEMEIDNSYFIFELPFQYCQISGISDGVFTFSFDMSYFDSTPEDLERYPDIFQSMYREYNTTGNAFQEVEPEKSICLKIDEELYYDIPPFAGLFADIFDIEEYKALGKVNSIIENYKFLIQKIPMRKESDKNNDFLIDLKTVNAFHGKTANVVPEEIGLIASPFEIDTVEFSKDNSNKDGVREAERSFYSAGGSNQALFNIDKPTNGILEKSIKIDEAEVFALLRQVERVINSKIKNLIKGTNVFRAVILDTTVFNSKEKTEMLLKGAQYGLPVKLRLLASYGLSPSAGVSMNFLEEDILGITDKFKPLKSSHTQTESASSEAGRPEVEDDELTEGGELQRDRADNESRQ